MKNKYDNKSSQQSEILIIRDLEEIEAIRHIWERLHAEESYPRINADIDRYLAAVKASDRSIEPYIIVLNEDGQPATMLIGMVDKYFIKCTIGRMTLFKPELRRLSVVHGGIIGKQTAIEADCVAAHHMHCGLGNIRVRI